MALFQRLAKNETGRDFVVGDVHGCFDVLRTLLCRVGFDEATDRLLSVGDLVDRGPSSHEAVDWLDKPWFIAVRGNHEQMAIEAALGMVDKGMHIVNGGQWFYGLDADGKRRTGLAFNEMPYAIEVDCPIGRVGLVHAEVPGDDWAVFTAALEASENERPANFDHLERFALWGRDVIRGRSPFDGVANIDIVFVGHTPVKDRCYIQNVQYIDTGACFGKCLTMVCLNDGSLTQEPPQ